MRNKLGMHIPEELSVLEGVTLAASLELDAFQVYLAARQNSWWPMKVSETLGDAVKKIKGDIWACAHAPFVVNILTDPGGYKYANHSWKSLVYHLERAEALGFQAVVFHMGSSGTLGPERGFDFAQWYLANVFSTYTGSVKLCIENDANPKKDPAGNFDSIIQLIEKFEKFNLRLCFDTTHAFAYGHDIRDSSILDKLLNKIEPYVEVVHFNQPKDIVTLGSFRDRHCDPISMGALGPEPMRQIWNFFEDKPFIIEGSPAFESDRATVRLW